MATRTKTRRADADLEPLPEGEDIAAATPRRGWTPEKLKGFLVKRFYTRFHMSLILMSCGLMGMLSSWALLHAGVQSMLVRYPIVICVAYLTFLTGVWAWLRYVGVERGEGGQRSSMDGGLDLGNLVPSGRGGSGGLGVPRGGGGSFDGGGASASWAQAEGAGAANLQTGAFAAVSEPGPGAASGGGTSGSGSSSPFSGIDFDLGGDGEGLVLVILAIALIAAIFAASGYLIWFAPDILGEAAFGAVLAGGLTRRSRNQDALGWVSGVVKKTWWPFALVLVLATGFAYWAGKHYPGAHTFREALDQVLVPQQPR